MDITCCYRCIRDGEVIHTTIDSVTKICHLMPDVFLDTTELELAEYCDSSYNGNERDFAGMCEAILLSNKDFALVVESGTIGYFVLQWDGYWRFLRTPLDNEDKGRQSVIPRSGYFTYVGYRRTKLKQFRSCSGIYRLTYNLHDKTFITSDGILRPMFNVEDFMQIDYHYAGYKDMLNNGAYAVMYRDGSPIFLDKVGDTLVLR